MKNLIVHTDNLNLKAIGRPDIYLKMECNQFSNSFKSRGIVCYLDHIEKINGLVTFTTGNHGIAVAAIAKEIGVEAIIISNAWISDYKKGIIEGLGAKIELINHNNLLDSTEYGKKIAANLGYSFVPLYDNEYLLKEYSGIAKEIVNDFGHQTITYFPIGSGSLLLSNSTDIFFLCINIKLKSIISFIRIIKSCLKCFKCNLSGISLILQHIF